jgi:hypothetical protein
MAENEDQPWNDENIEDPWPAQRPQRVRQPPVRFGYNQPGNPALFCQAVNTNLQPWQMTPYPGYHHNRNFGHRSRCSTLGKCFIRRCATHQRRFTPLGQ